MERVTGVGGMFFRAVDPDELTRWYAAHLGVDPAPESYEVSSWWQQAGPTVFAAMPADSAHFGALPRAVHHAEIVDTVAEEQHHHTSGRSSSR